MLSKRIKAVHPSPTLAISAKAKAMKAAGENVITLSAGEPDFATPPHITMAAVKALSLDDTRYGPAAGKPQLRSSIANYLSQLLHLEVDPSEVIVGVGGKQILFEAISSLVEQGDEVLLPAPYWVSFPDMITFSEATVVPVPSFMRDNFVPALEELEKHITEKTQLFILNSPHNPTGTVLPREYLVGLSKLLDKYEDIFIISDETYERLTYDDLGFSSILQVAPHLRDRTLVVGSFSKAYAMTGWRLGYGFGPKDLVDAMGRTAGASTSGPASFVQTAGIAALEGNQTPVEKMRATFQKRRDLVVKLLATLPHVRFAVPQGAFYIFIDISHYTQNSTNEEVRDSASLANYLLEEQKLAVVPGSAFGTEGFLRLSFVASMDDIRTGIARLEAGLKALLS